jgi:hypothetical protein
MNVHCGCCPKEVDFDFCAMQSEEVAIQMELSKSMNDCWCYMHHSKFDGNIKLISFTVFEVLRST